MRKLEYSLKGIKTPVGVVDVVCWPLSPPPPHTSGPGPSFSSRLGGLRHQPLQRHAHARVTVLTAAFFAVPEEEAAATRLCVGRLSVELATCTAKSTDCPQTLKSRWTTLPGWRLPRHQWGLCVVKWCNSVMCQASIHYSCHWLYSSQILLPCLVMVLINLYTACGDQIEQSQAVDFAQTFMVLAWMGKSSFPATGLAAPSCYVCNSPFHSDVHVVHCSEPKRSSVSCG